MKKIQIDCRACNSAKTMEPAIIPKFSSFIRFLGFLIIIPSIIGVFFAIIILYSTGVTTNDIMSNPKTAADVTGTAFVASAGIGFSVFIGVSSLVSGLIGWLLLIKRKVFKCNNCGSIIDRA